MTISSAYCSRKEVRMKSKHEVVETKNQKFAVRIKGSAEMIGRPFEKKEHAEIFKEALDALPRPRVAMKLAAA